VTLLAGDGGLGKSTLAQDLAARMTRGDGPPGEPKGRARGVVILTAEENLSDMVRPRLRKMGARLDRVVVIEPVWFSWRLG
jgi:RecA-family ATPase